MRLLEPVAAAVIAAALLPLTACAAPAAAPAAQVVVRIQPAAEPTDYEVHLAEAEGGFRAVHTMRSGQTRTFAVPAGWMTVRVPGVCVVPTPASGTSTVEIGPDDCSLD